MRKREHLRKLKKDRLKEFKWLPSLLNLDRDDIEKDEYIESRLRKLQKLGFYPFDHDDPSIWEHLKKNPALGAKHVLDLFEFRDILISIITSKSGNIRIFTRIYNIKDYVSRGRQWRTKLAGDVLDAWFKNHKFRFSNNTFRPEAETYTDELKLMLARFLSDFTFEQNISSCEVCGKYFLRHDAKFKTCGNRNCSLTSVKEIRKKLRVLRDKRMREYWESEIKDRKKWGEWKREYRFNREGVKAVFYDWYEKSYSNEFRKLRTYGLIRAKKAS